MEGAAGVSVASPLATPIRARKNCVKLAHSPQQAVMNDQQTIPAAINRIRFDRSAIMPAANQHPSAISTKLTGPVSWRKVVLFIACSA